MATPISRSSQSKVRVVLRVRPFLPSELDSNDHNPIPCITVLNSDEHRTADEDNGDVTVHLKDQRTSRNECYKLDSFFGQGDSIGQIFRSEVAAVIPAIFQGHNATVFAYGATGSGKTYTMQGTDGEPGLIPLAMSTIFSMCENNVFSVEISYYEVYMDRCYDLLEPKAKEISTLDDKEGRLQLKGLSSVAVRSMDEFTEFFATAIQRRKVAQTGLNDVSSRSHGVLAVVVTNCDIRGKLNLIDLAGSEDNRRTCNEGVRLQESAKINQSLFALSNVIYALNNNQPRIPYRESKLTRILQDSLGGPSRALMIACLNPAAYQEAVHTVSLAARSRHIVNYLSSNKKEAPKEKVDMEAKLKAWLESKGKTKSIQRSNGPFSPSLGKTPTSTRSVKQSLKTKTGACVVLGTKGRKLFDSGAAVSSILEETNSCEASAIKAQGERILNDCPFIVKNDYYQATSAVHEGQLESSESVVHSCNSGILKEQESSCLNRSPSNSKDGNSESGMTSPFYVNNQVEMTRVGDFSQHKFYAKKESNTSGFSILKSPDLPGTHLNNKNLHSPLQNSLKRVTKVLSPISTNIIPIKHLSPDNRICLSSEPKTPHAPYAIACDKHEAGMIRTPLDKFNALSSNLKESLAQEYLDFLNVASKEELLQLKGIGQRRAEYILELRESSPNPLKSLSDLENIGLSSKQVHDMFRRMARGIFT